MRPLVASRRYSGESASVSPDAITLLHASTVTPRRPRYAVVPVGYVVGLVVAVTIPAATFWTFATHVTWVAPIGWVLLPLMALVLLGVCGLIGAGAFEHVRAACRPQNWLAQLGATGVHLHVRSFLNWRYPSHVPTVAFVPWGAIEAVRAVHETFVVPFRQHRTIRYHSFTVLTLRPGIDTAALDAAVRAELLRVPNAPRLAELFHAWDDVPVFVADGEIWIVHRHGRLFRALSRPVPVRATEYRRTPGDAIVALGSRASIRRLALEALYRGRRVDAARTLGQAFGLDAAESDRALLDALTSGG